MNVRLPLVTDLAVARALGITPRRVNQLIRNSAFPHVRIPNTNEVRFDLADVGRWIESHKQPVTAASTSPE